MPAYATANTSWPGMLHRAGGYQLVRLQHLGLLSVAHAERLVVIVPTNTAAATDIC